MEQIQLFKRLLAITEDEIRSFIKHDEDVSKSLLMLNLAARTRYIIDAVQLEDMWQQIDEESHTFDLYLAMRLSPMTLGSCLDFDVDMNCLQWHLVLPKYADIADESKPTCAYEYLAMMKQIDIVDVEKYDVEKTCMYLDQVYDFTLHKQDGRAPFTRLA